MSNGLNRQQIFGNIGADPELRTTQGGTSVLNMRIAATESWKDKDGKQQEYTEWFSVVVWGARAEALAKLVRKGDPIYVEGSTRTNSYEKDGVKHYRTEVHAKEILLCGRGNGGAGPKTDQKPNDYPKDW